jgi:hypothetical protein
MTGGQLQISWSEPVWSSSGYTSMSPVSASFWHAAGTGALVDLLTVPAPQVVGG